MVAITAVFEFPPRESYIKEEKIAFYFEKFNNNLILQYNSLNMFLT